MRRLTCKYLFWSVNLYYIWFEFRYQWILNFYSIYIYIYIITFSTRDHYSRFLSFFVSGTNICLLQYERGWTYYFLNALLIIRRKPDHQFFCKAEKNTWPSIYKLVMVRNFFSRRRMAVSHCLWTYLKLCMTTKSVSSTVF